MKLSEAITRLKALGAGAELPEELKHYVKHTGARDRPWVFDEVELKALMSGAGVVGINDYDPARDAQIQNLVADFFDGLDLAPPAPRLRPDGVDLHGPDMQAEQLAAAKMLLADELLEFLASGGTVDVARAFCAELKTIIAGAPLLTVFELPIDEAFDEGLNEVRRTVEAGAASRLEAATARIKQLEARKGDRANATWRKAVEAAERAGHTGTKAITKAMHDNPELYEQVKAMSQRSKR